VDIPIIYVYIKSCLLRRSTECNINSVGNISVIRQWLGCKSASAIGASFCQNSSTIWAFISVIVAPFLSVACKLFVSVKNLRKFSNLPEFKHCLLKGQKLTFFQKLQTTALHFGHLHRYGGLRTLKRDQYQQISEHFCPDF
jgi:hypothetical protein